MATTVNNTPSLSLFTDRLHYSPFCFPSILARPVHAHDLPIAAAAAGSGVGGGGDSIFSLPTSAACSIYSHLVPNSSIDFLPSDLSSLLSHKLTIGSFLALPSQSMASPHSFALLSIWDSTSLLSLRVAGTSALTRSAVSLLRAIDKRLPFLHLPSIPDIFRPFGAYILYGIQMGGRDGARLLRSLCHHAHNLARRNPRCGVVLAEIGRDDPVRSGIPHWRSFSYDGDVWCVKNLAGNGGIDRDECVSWEIQSEIVFVDPREF